MLDERASITFEPVCCKTDEKTAHALISKSASAISYQCFTPIHSTQPQWRNLLATAILK